MGLSWWFHGTSMGLPWDFSPSSGDCGTCASVGVPWFFRGTPMVLPWDLRGFRGSPMVFHWTAIRLVCGASRRHSWDFYGSIAMEVPWGLRVGEVHYPCLPFIFWASETLCLVGAAWQLYGRKRVYDGFATRQFCHEYLIQRRHPLPTLSAHHYPRAGCDVR